jgi:hypothetical protein
MLEHTSPYSPGAASRALRTPPSSSRMLASYLSDIEQLLEEQRWDAALRDAADLPRIAVALSDPLLRSSHDEVSQWCERWISPVLAAGPETRLTPDTTADAIRARVRDSAVTASVPTAALRRLQLRRHARTPPRGFVLGPDENLDPQAAEAEQTGRTLVEATRRWYARSGVHEPTVQSNLARLAVLR